MILTSEDRRTEFELCVLGYQFPDIEHEEYDSNWLMVQINVRTSDGAWSSVDPCLLTWEAHWLFNWLADLVSDREHDPEMSFLESNLFFSLRGKHARCLDLRVSVSSEVRPVPDVSAACDELEIELEIPFSGLRECIIDFSRELGSFPVRAGGTRRRRPYSDPRTDCVLCNGPRAPGE